MDKADRHPVMNIKLVWQRIVLSRRSVFAMGALCGMAALGSVNIAMNATHHGQWPTEFVPGTKIIETKLDEQTFAYVSSYTAAETRNVPAAPLVDRMADRTRKQSDRAFVMLSFDPTAFCETAAAHHAHTAILMRPLSEDPTEIVTIPLDKDSGL